MNPESAKFGILKFGQGRFGVDSNISISPFPLAFFARKKLGKPEYDDPLNVMGIYRVRTIQGTVTQEKLPFYRPTDPKTIPQQANRQRFADAMAAWTALTPEQKKVYNVFAKRQQKFGWNIFIKEYFASHPL